MGSSPPGKTRGEPGARTGAKARLSHAGRGRSQSGSPTAPRRSCMTTGCCSANSAAVHRRDSAFGYAWRHVSLTLATLALALKVLVPAGMMVSSEPRNELPIPIVLCTAQGAVSIEPGAPLSQHGDHEQGEKAKHDAPCVFAGHSVGATPPGFGDIGRVEFAAYAATAPARAPAVSPGRGVSGPPLPPRGPPAQLI